MCAKNKPKLKSLLAFYKSNTRTLVDSRNCLQYYCVLYVTNKITGISSNTHLACDTHIYQTALTKILGRFLAPFLIFVSIYFTLEMKYFKKYFMKLGVSSSLPLNHRIYLNLSRQK